MPEDRRPTFTALLELFSVIEDIGECVTFHSGIEKDLGGGVTIQKVDRNRSKVAITQSFWHLIVISYHLRLERLD